MEPIITLRMTQEQFNTISELFQECACSDEETQIASALEQIEEQQWTGADISNPTTITEINITFEMEH